MSNPVTEGQRARKYYVTVLKRHKRRVINRGTSPPIHNIEKSNYTMSCSWIEILCFDICAYCGKPGQDIDHIVPLHISGMAGNRWDNLTASCQNCNNKKGTLSLLHFLREEE